MAHDQASKSTKQRRDDGRDPYVQPPRRGGMPRPTLTAPGRRPWALATEGACARLDPEVLALEPFGVDDGAQAPERAELATAICGQCPLQRRCLDYAMANEPYGIWGGLDARQRLLQRGEPLPSYEERVASAKIREWFARGMTAAQVAERLSVTRRTIERWRAEAGLVEPRGYDEQEAGSPGAAA